MNEKGFAFVFLTLIFFFGIFTANSAKMSIRYIVDNTSRANNNIQDFSKNLDKVLKDGFFKKKSVVNFYGLFERLMGKRLSTDGFYYRDTLGTMHLRSSPRTFENFFRDINWMSAFCKSRGTPLLIVQKAERGFYGDLRSKNIDGAQKLSYAKTLEKKVLQNGDLYLNSPRLFLQKGFSEKDIFFKTDLHCTTLSEIEELKEIVRILQERGVKFFCAERALDFENNLLYKKTSRKLLGNLSAQYGTLYAGVDEFEYFIPLFKTDFVMKNKDCLEFKKGAFENSIMNGYLEDGKQFKYWITDFLQWPEPYYEILNNECSQGPSVLCFIDSQSMRAVSYLSLMCKNVVVLDPRYFNDANNFFNKVKDRNFCAVIVFATQELFRGLSYN